MYYSCTHSTLFKVQCTSFATGEDSDCGWLTDKTCEMIMLCLSSETSSDPSVAEFRKMYRKKIYKGGKLSSPNFCIEEDANHDRVLCRISRYRGKVSTRQILTSVRAKEVITAMHCHDGGVCAPGGINALVSKFTAKYYCRGIRSIAKQILDECSGTCKLTKVLQTAPPVPHANRSMHIMEQVQCDLITVTSQKGGFSSAQHDFKYILSVKDCFSKFCWLTPLESKKAGPIASVLARIFRDCGPPKYLQSDNGKEFVNKILGFLCKSLGIHTKHGRPYHPQSQGQVENLNKRVKNCLRHFLLRYTEEERCDMWPFVIQDVAYFINHSWHHTIKSTPHTIFFGRSPKCSTFDSHNNTGFMPEDYVC